MGRQGPVNRGLAHTQWTGDCLARRDLVGRHGAGVVRIKRAVGQQFLLRSHRNEMHAAIVRSDVLEGNPENKGVIRRIFAVERGILVPGRAESTMWFFVQGQVTRRPCMSP